MATYEYSVDSFPNHAVDPSTFLADLVAEYHFAPTIGVSADATTCWVTTAEPLTDEQKSTLDLAVSLHDGVPHPFEKKHFEQAFLGGFLSRETWWARSADGGQTLSRKVEETLYTYAAANLLTEEWTRYDPFGNVAEHRMWDVMQQKVGQQITMRKVER